MFTGTRRRAERRGDERKGEERKEWSGQGMVEKGSGKSRPQRIFVSLFLPDGVITVQQVSISAEEENEVRALARPEKSFGDLRRLDTLADSSVSLTSCWWDSLSHGAPGNMLARGAHTPLYV